MIGRTNTGGGGLSDTDALLRVVAPAGSLVTITKGTLTKTDHGHENASDPLTYDYYFIIHQSQFDSINAWTVTATLNGQTASNTIIIDASDEYDLVMSYHVPVEYQEVDYLEGTGTQYIATGADPTSTTEIDIVYALTTTTQTVDSAVIGTGKSGTAGAEISMYKGSGSALTARYYTSTVALPFDTNKHTVSMAPTGVTIDGTTTAISPSYVAIGSKGFSLFAKTWSNTTNVYYNKCRIYYCQIRNGSIVLRTLYPCYRKADSVAGMWDAENSVFYTNNGSGTFVVGGNV